MNEVAKRKLWDDFALKHKIEQDSVPLFSIVDGVVAIAPYGDNQRSVLKRSHPMEVLMRDLGKQLIQQHSESNIRHDGILYMMLAHKNGQLKPLYIGKAETLGKVNGNLACPLGSDPLE